MRRWTRALGLGATAIALSLGGCGGGETAGRPSSPPCRTDGCLVDHTEEVGHDGLDELAPDFPVDPSVRAITLHRITYRTRVRGALVEVAANVALPSPLPKELYVVTNNPGTSGLAPDCEGAGHAASRGLASVFAAQGWVGVSFDYPTPNDVEAYLVQEVEAATVLDGVRATRTFIERAILPDHRSSALMPRAVITGFSRGAHATLAAAAAYAQDDRGLEIAGFLAAAPPAMIESFWSEGLGAAETLARGDLDAQFGARMLVHYTAMVVQAWQSFYGEDLSPWAPGFDASLLRTCVTFPDAPDRLEGTLPTRIPADPRAVFSNTFVDRFTSPSFAANAGPFTSLHEWFRDNEVRPFVSRAPILVLQGTADGLAPQTREMVRRFRDANAASQLTYEEADGIDHMGLALLPFRQAKTDAALAFVRAHLAP